MRRKGEKPVVHEPLSWSEGSPVARMIRTGDRWFHAWSVQQCVRSFRTTGISAARITELDLGAPPTKEELLALAGLFRTDLQSLQASIVFEQAVKDVRPPVAVFPSADLADATAQFGNATGDTSSTN